MKTQILIFGFFFTLVLSSVGQDQGTFTDKRNNQTYKWVRIGDQIWMAKNLAYEANSGCWAYKNNKSNVNQYGYLYSWEMACNVCPDGWHLPDNEEWMELITFISTNNEGCAEIKEGFWTNVGKYLKSQTGWKADGNGTDNYNFNGLPAGSRNLHDKTVSQGELASWWSTSEDSTNSAFGISLFSNNNILFHIPYQKKLGYSVRCIKD